jgi:hypothetical protein
MGRKKAIQNVLARLGMQASASQVVLALADIGMAVNEGLVRRVKLEMVREAAKVERQQVTIPKLPRLKFCRPKMPPRRATHS